MSINTEDGRRSNRNPSPSKGATVPKGSTGRPVNKSNPSGSARPSAASASQKDPSGARKRPQEGLPKRSAVPAPSRGAVAIAENMERSGKGALITSSAGKGSARKKKAASKPKKKGSALTRMAMAAFFVYAVVTIISGQVSLSEKRQQLADLKERSASLTAENEEYQRLIQLSMEDERAYMEAIAVDKLGYAYPAEIRFYDPARG